MRNRFVPEMPAHLARQISLRAMALPQRRKGGWLSIAADLAGATGWRQPALLLGSIFLLGIFLGAQFEDSYALSQQGWSDFLTLGEI